PATPAIRHTLVTRVQTCARPITDYTYAWQTCDGQGTNCQTIPTSNHSTYTPGDGDIGSTIRVIVTATNPSGTSSPATSDATAARSEERRVGKDRPARRGAQNCRQ